MANPTAANYTATSASHVGHLNGIDNRFGLLGALANLDTVSQSELDAAVGRYAVIAKTATFQVTQAEADQSAYYLWSAGDLQLDGLATGTVLYGQNDAVASLNITTGGGAAVVVGPSSITAGSMFKIVWTTASNVSVVNYGASAAASSPPPSVTLADLSAVGNAINTTDKSLGKEVFVTDSGLFAKAAGAAAADIWLNAGITVATPV